MHMGLEFLSAIVADANRLQATYQCRMEDGLVYTYRVCVHDGLMDVFECDEAGEDVKQLCSGCSTVSISKYLPLGWSYQSLVLAAGFAEEGCRGSGVQPEWENLPNDIGWHWKATRYGDSGEVTAFYVDQFMLGLYRGVGDMRGKGVHIKYLPIESPKNPLFN